MAGWWRWICNVNYAGFKIDVGYRWISEVRTYVRSLAFAIFGFVGWAHAAGVGGVRTWRTHADGMLMGWLDTNCSIYSWLFVCLINLPFLISCRVNVSIIPLSGHWIIQSEVFNRILRSLKWNRESHYRAKTAYRLNLSHLKMMATEFVFEIMIRRSVSYHYYCHPTYAFPIHRCDRSEMTLI